MKRTRWTEQELEKLKELSLSGKTHKEIGVLLNRSANAVRERSSRLKLNIKRRYTDNDIDTIKNMINDGFSYQEIANKLNRSAECIADKCYKLNINSKHGQDFLKCKYMKSQGLSRCRICKVFRESEEFNNKWKSRLCNECLNKAKTENDINAVIFRLREGLTRARGRAKKTSLECSITLTFLINQWNKQNGKCFYSGKDMTVCSGDLSISLDRINSNVGYTKSNTILCCWRVNIMKNDLNDKQFLEWCKHIASYLLDNN